MIDLTYIGMFISLLVYSKKHFKLTAKHNTVIVQ